ncbi:MAG: YgfZ/GcvT domain-containing protein [Acidocella sp.]|uniref:CAF17-like 4Fe-4S cluster assembly/insertion protein YgfZ n=1 Tax=Acidocella sp. TaxID=50710 RepID=UPI003FBD6B9F
MTKLAHLPQRGVLALRGADRITFLNGLVSNDVTKAAPGCDVWAALLTPQGKYLSDFFIFADADALLLDAPRADIPGLLTKLRRYRLRAQVELEDASSAYGVYAAWDGVPPEVAISAPDPRLEQAGWRLLSEAPLAANASAADYAAHRIALGLPDGAPDLEPEKTLLLEAGFDELHGIAWDKGCYMGQELTARTKYRGLVKRRLVPVELSVPGAAPGTPVMADGHEVGDIRSSAGNLALAMLRLDAVEKVLAAGDARLTSRIPAWMQLPHLTASSGTA